MFILPVSFIKSASGFTNTKSLEFDGVDDYVSISNSPTLDITGNGSISFWINATTLANYTGIVSKVKYTSGVVSNAQYHIETLSSGVRCVITGTDLKIGSEDVGTVPTITTGVWEHYVLTWDGSDLTLYKNGVFAASKTQVSNPSTNTDPVLIGYRNGFNFFDGKMDEVAIFNTVLSAGDVTAMYNSGTPTDLTSLSPVAWYRMGENSTFKSPQILMPEQSNKDKVSNYSMAFDGTGDYVSCGTSLGDLIGDNYNGSLSASLWFKRNSNTLGGLINFTTSSWGEFTVVAYVDKIRFAINATAYYIDYDSTAGYVYDTNWHHLAVVMTPDGGGTTDIKMYFDGQLLTITPSGSSPISSNLDFAGKELFIGTFDASNYSFDGYIDEVSFFTSELTTPNVTSIYNLGTPTDLTGESGLVGYYRMGEEAVFNSTNWLLPNKAQDVFSRYSLEFDGVDDYIDSNFIIPAISTYTISLWIKKNGVPSGNQGLIGDINSSGQAKSGRASIGVRSTGYIYVSMGDGSAYWYDKTSYDLSAYLDNAWHHIALTIDGTALKLYIDGGLKYTYTSTVSAGTIGARPYRIGNYYDSASNGWGGYIDEVSIFNEVKDIGDLWDGTGQPTDLTGESGLVSWYRMGEDATFSTNWTIPDQAGSNDGTSANMTNDDLTGDAPGVTGNGTSANMTIEDRVGDAPDSENNSLSYNMDAADIVEETP